MFQRLSGQNGWASHERAKRKNRAEKRGKRKKMKSLRKRRGLAVQT